MKNLQRTLNESIFRFHGRIRQESLSYSDRISIEVRVIHIGQSSITWGYRGYRRNEEEMVVEGQNVTVCVRTDTFEKIDVPEWLRQGLTSYMERFNKKVSQNPQK